MPCGGELPNDIQVCVACEIDDLRPSARLEYGVVMAGQKYCLASSLVINRELNYPVNGYALLADLVLVLHAVIVMFVILGLALTLAGGVCGWRWVRNPWFRLTHLLTITVVVVQSWFGVVCPLTTWEIALRAKSNQAAYQASFVAHWLEQLLYYQAPPWVFVVVYTLFGFLVLLTWIKLPPRPF